MPSTKRSIGGEGLEQGGMSLGNDITRSDLSGRDAGDALTDLPTMKKDDETDEIGDDEFDDDTLLADDELAEDEEDIALLPDESDDEEDEKL